MHESVDSQKHAKRMFCESCAGQLENVHCTRRNIFQILLNQSEIRLFLPFRIDLDPNRRPFGSKSIGKW